MINLIRGFMYDVLDDSVEMMEIAIEFIPHEWPWLAKSLDFGKERLIDCMQMVDPL